MQGSVRWFNAAKGFGFITGSDGTEYFVHHRHIKEEGFRTLAPGEPVQFGTEFTLRGAAAVEVKRGGQA